MSFLLYPALASLAAWIYLAAGHHRFWHADQRLAPIAPDASAPDASAAGFASDPAADISSRRSTAPAHDWPDISIIIPARDEAETIARVVTAHRQCDYRGTYRIIVIDDRSDDDTAMLARHAGADRVITAPPVPPQWSGKMNGVKAGLVDAARIAPDTEFFLLSDADILFAPSTLTSLVAKARCEGLSLVSLMARLDARGLWGGLLMPAFVYFFQKLYPFPAVNRKAAPIAGAAGGCMLVRRDALEASGGIDQIAHALIDDCALARSIKNVAAREAQARRAIWLGLADDEAISLRDNRALASIWKMVERTAFAQLGRSWLLLILSVFGMVIIYVAPPVITVAGFLGGAPVAACVALGAWALMTMTFRPTARLYALQWPFTPCLPVAGFLYTLMTISSAMLHARGKGVEWKGRRY